MYLLFADGDDDDDYFYSMKHIQIKLTIYNIIHICTRVTVYKIFDGYTGGRILCTRRNAVHC